MECQTGSFAESFQEGGGRKTSKNGKLAHGLKNNFWVDEDEGSSFGRLTGRGKEKDRENRTISGSPPELSHSDISLQTKQDDKNPGDRWDNIIPGDNNFQLANYTYQDSAAWIFPLTLDKFR